jgi:hypothetical protein
MSEIRAVPAGFGGQIEEAVHFEVEIMEKIEVLVLPIDGTPHVEVIRERMSLEGDLELFERDTDEPFRHAQHGRRHVRLVGHKCHHVTLKVHYEQHTKDHQFRPSAMVGRALQWAVGKHGYHLDPMQAAKANLILPGADQPLPKEDVLGKYIKPGDCALTVALTLKDFSNG